tara:strand:+ start:413 stop:550 length:138 start_codon:yes stop_codon:yes gene_type:complete
MFKPMNVGDSADVCLQSAEKLVEEGVASYEYVQKQVKTKQVKKES